jgi:hypothetical protein
VVGAYALVLPNVRPSWDDGQMSEPGGRVP